MRGESVNAYLVEQGSAQSAALREQTDRTQFGLGKTAVADKHRVHVARIVHAHAIRSDDTTLVLIRQTHDFVLSMEPRFETHFCFDSLLRTGLTETSRNNGHPLGSTLKALLQRVHGELCRDRNDDALDFVGNLGGRLVNRLIKQLST